MVRLLDANLLIALAWPVHVHYEAARAWFGAHRDEGWATCSFTEAAFVRISSNPRVFASATTPAQAGNVGRHGGQHRIAFLEPHD